MSDNLTFNDHKANLFKAMNGMRKTLEPLNERLRPLKMMLWVADGSVWINRSAANDDSGGGIYINDDIIKKMLAMSDDQLIKKNQGLLNERHYRPRKRSSARRIRTQLSQSQTL